MLKAVKRKQESDLKGVLLLFGGVFYGTAMKRGWATFYFFLCQALNELQIFKIKRKD